MTTLLSLSICLMAGLLMSRAAKPLGLPAVTGYLVAGIIIGPYCLGQLSMEGLGFVNHSDVESFEIISNVALGFIAFSIGNEFRIEQLKKTGKRATVIAFAEALGAAVVVDIVLLILHFIIPETLTVSMAISLGAIATATAPAATMMVVKQYKAKGPVTEVLLPVVALDDAICLVVFAISFGVAKALTNGEFDFISIVVNPALEIVASIVLGSLVGYCFTFLERFFHSNSKRLSLSIGFVILTVGLSSLELPIGPVTLSFSPLLCCMMLGTIFCNICDFSAELMERADRWTAPLYVVFFVVSGAELELDVFKNIYVVIIGLVYIIFRCVGKYGGARLGASLTKSDDNIKKYLGITLFPQAGVALGMSMQVGELGDDGALIRNIILFGVLVYELIGPTLTKISLKKSGEIQPKA